MKTLISAGAVFTPVARIDDGAVLISDGTVVACAQRRSLAIGDDIKTYDFPDAVLAPGYVDLHLHGAAGHDVMNCDVEKLAHIGRFLARHGVTAYLPTTITAPLDDMLRALDRLSAAIEHFEKAGARAFATPIGIHVEGPFISYARRGVHASIHILQPSVELFDRFWNAAHGRIKMLTIAPEMPEALAVIAEATKRGVAVSLGHTNAEYGKAREGIEAGAHHATHCFNAMRRLEHRDPGVLGVVLVDREVTADIIADGLHVLPPVVDLFLRSKGVEGAVLISDGTSATGMPDGTYHLGSFEVTVAGLRCESFGKLAGSVLTLDVAVRNVMKFAGWQLQDAVRLASLNPARVINDPLRGHLGPGALADVNVLSKSGEVLGTFIGGVAVQRAGAAG